MAVIGGVDDGVVVVFGLALVADEGVVGYAGVFVAARARRLGKAVAEAKTEGAAKDGGVRPLDAGAVVSAKAGEAVVPRRADVAPADAKVRAESPQGRVYKRVKAGAVGGQPACRPRAGRAVDGVGRAVGGYVA